jgi:phosphoglycerol transferase
LLRRAGTSVTEQRMRQLSLLSVVGFLVATIGGLSTFISLLVSGDIRSWNRMSVFIGLCAFACVGLLIDAGVRRAGARRQRPLTIAALAVVLGVGFVDQVTPMWVPAYASVDATFLNDQKYFRSIEQRMGADSSAFILPRIEFPESPTLYDLSANDELVPYLQTASMKWSFGGVKGRPESARQERLPYFDTPKLVTDITAAGFSGILVERKGYPDNGQALEAQLQAITQEAPIENADHRFAFYDLRTYRATVAPTTLQTVHDALLYPVTVVNRDHFFDREHDASSAWTWADGTGGALDLENDAHGAERADVSFTVDTATDAPANFFVVWPDGSRQTVRTAGNGDPMTISRVVTVPEGASRVRIGTDAAGLPSGVDGRDLHFRMLDADVKAS